VRRGEGRKVRKVNVKKLAVSYYYTVDDDDDDYAATTAAPPPSSFYPRGGGEKLHRHCRRPLQSPPLFQHTAPL
jgi:hypothetical protein